MRGGCVSGPVSELGGLSAADLIQIGGIRMNMFKTALLGATFLAGALSAAQAGGLKDGPDYDGYGAAWVGFYAGAHAGIAWASAEATARASYGGQTVTASAEADSTDFIAGLQGGYNWLTPGNTLYGVEVDYSFINGDVGTIRGRIGQVMGDKMIYATAGIAFPDEADAGFVVGAGVEWDLNHRWQNVTAGVEGLYYTFSEEYSYGFARAEVDVDAFVLRGRVNYHFGRGGEVLK